MSKAKEAHKEKKKEPKAKIGKKVPKYLRDEGVSTCPK